QENPAAAPCRSPKPQVAFTPCITAPRGLIRPLPGSPGSTFASRLASGPARTSPGPLPFSVSEETRRMVARRWVAVAILAFCSLGAQYRTKNFLVEAATPEIAKHIGEWAEYHRKHKALEWLGQEMPPWPQPCPLQVKVSYNGSGGATSFAFDQGRIL